MSDTVLKASDSETAYAKINLALHVRGRLDNGYHDIETIFAFLDKGDLVSVAPGDGLKLDIDGPFSDGLSETENLILQAARRLAEVSGVDKGAYLHLDKQLPIASGIGGGSADAAATLRLLNRFWGLDLALDTLAEIAKPLGADVPACVISQTCSGTGIGHDLTTIADQDLRECTALLINPMIPVSTADIFNSWDGVDHGPLSNDSVLVAAKKGRNDLQPQAVALVPILSDVLQLLGECEPVIARMSGSGATCFALFDTPGVTHDAERHCRRAMDNSWTMIGKFR
ncbi:4-(cytidine 5'-diphospho)-2-C-methyl-D-erythritol kinase [Parasphingorhabdus sp.]|uniref:4-(cytidine 5'-diphospho)-2-C-methyl-D-erythritol kinase n=1 Tax=Parasphingorhabdus sp. TaxID=2709688 RepID=UPI003266DEBB